MNYLNVCVSATIGPQTSKMPYQTTVIEHSLRSGSFALWPCQKPVYGEAARSARSIYRIDMSNDADVPYCIGDCIELRGCMTAAEPDPPYMTKWARQQSLALTAA